MSSPSKTYFQSLSSHHYISWVWPSPRLDCLGDFNCPTCFFTLELFDVSFYCCYCCPVMKIWTLKWGDKRVLWRCLMVLTMEGNEWGRRCLFEKKLSAGDNSSLKEIEFDFIQNKWGELVVCFPWTSTAAKAKVWSSSFSLSQCWFLPILNSLHCCPIL